LQLRPDGRYILVITQPNFSVAHVELLMDSLLKVADTTLLLRPHPAEPADRYLGFQGPRVQVRPSDEILTLILASSVVVIQGSTVGLEAAALGKPVIAAAMGMDLPLDFAAHGIAVRVDTPDALVRAVISAVANPGHAPDIDHAVITDLVGPLDGQSTRRTRDFILDLLQRPPVTVGRPEQEPSARVNPL
jgi:glycosyltransferase involved in cell wall biosynthesis